MLSNCTTFDYCYFNRGFTIAHCTVMYSYHSSNWWSQRQYWKSDNYREIMNTDIVKYDKKSKTRLKATIIAILKLEEWKL